MTGWKKIILGHHHSDKRNRSSSIKRVLEVWMDTEISVKIINKKRETMKNAPSRRLPKLT